MKDSRHFIYHHKILSPLTHRYLFMKSIEGVVNFIKFVNLLSQIIVSAFEQQSTTNTETALKVNGVKSGAHEVALNELNQSLAILMMQ